MVLVFLLLLCGACLAYRARDTYRWGPANQVWRFGIPACVVFILSAGAAYEMATNQFAAFGSPSNAGFGSQWACEFYGGGASVCFRAPASTQASDTTVAPQK
jgi:hypothetical protein